MTEAERERAAIVEWLRGEANWQASMRDVAKAAAYYFAADTIQHGDHHKEDSKHG